MEGDLLVRAATPADYKAVLDINRNVYEGFDYLPIYYHIYLQSPDCHSFVGELDGKIVAYVAARVIDGGLTMITAAGRADPSLGRQGVFGKLLYPAIKLVQKRVPTLQFSAHAGVGAKHFDIMREASKTGKAPERIVMKWNLLIFQGTKEDIGTSVSRLVNLSKDTEVLGIDRAKEVFADITNLVSLFPTRYLVCYQNWRPLRASYDILIDAVRSHFTLVTFREGSTSKVKALSFSFTDKIPMGTRIDVYYYDVVPTTDLLHQHVKRHIQHAVSITNGDEKVHLVLHFPYDHDVESAKKSLKPFLGNSFLTKTFHRENVVLAEGPLEPHTLGSKMIARL